MGSDIKYQLALSLFGQGVISDETNNLLGDVLTSRPDNLKALQLASRIAIERRDFLGALVHVDKILKQKPTLISFHIQKAEMSERMFEMDTVFAETNPHILPHSKSR